MFNEASAEFSVPPVNFTITTFVEFSDSGGTTPSSLDDLRDRLCEALEDSDRLELGLKVTKKELQDLGYTLVKTEDERASLISPANEKVLVAGHPPPLSIANPAPLIVAVRGKELVLGFKKYAIRVSFATQGHCFWIPNADFEGMVEGGAEPFTSKGKSYPLPIEFQAASKGQVLNEKRHVRIAMSVRGPSHTLIFVDHNMLLRFHILKFKTPLKAQDLVPGSEAWPLLWGKNHGPDAVLEREAWLSEYDAWIDRIG
ncbi:hypothetical protein FRC01_002189 [Tulasnella sp. 417]|nr:hypothetical protein FRC01_002189 [Tulasnella sp. 417]